MQRDAGRLFTREVTLEYGATAPAVQRSDITSIPITAQPIVWSIVRRLGWTKCVDGVSNGICSRIIRSESHSPS